jgi:hypothetical protein
MITIVTRPLKKEKTLLRLLLLNVFLILLETIIILVKSKALPERVPLLYSRPWGEEQLVKSQYLFVVPSLSFLLFLINFGITSLFIKKNEKFMAFISNGFALLFTSLGFITLLRIILLVS